MLTELLQLLHTGEARWTSLEVDVREWKDRDGLQAVAERASAAFFGGPPSGRPAGCPACRGPDRYRGIDAVGDGDVAAGRPGGQTGRGRRA